MIRVLSRAKVLKPKGCGQIVRDVPIALDNDEVMDELGLLVQMAFVFFC